MTRSLVAPKVYEISDISYSHIVDTKEDIRISVIEEKLSFHSTQAFSSDSAILNYVQSLPMIASENEEEFDFSLSNVVVVHKSNNLDVLEEISYFRSDPFTLIDLEIPGNSYMIQCTNT